MPKITASSRARGEPSAHSRRLHFLYLIAHNFRAIFLVSRIVNMPDVIVKIPGGRARELFRPPAIRQANGGGGEKRREEDRRRGGLNASRSKIEDGILSERGKNLARGGRTVRIFYRCNGAPVLYVLPAPGPALARGFSFSFTMADVKSSALVLRVWRISRSSDTGVT